MEWLNELLKQPLIKWTLFSLLIIVSIVFVTFFVQYNIDRAKGKHAKFLWFETNIPAQEMQILNSNKGDKQPKDTTLKEESKEGNKILKNTDVMGKKENPVKQNVTISHSKNVNTGENYGRIGDTYKGIEQRHFTEKDAKELITQIEQYKITFKGKIDTTHITIGYPGDKESKIVAIEAEKILRKNGFNNIQVSTLLTYGVTGKLFGVSNAPDKSILVEIYPADNVQ